MATREKPPENDIFQLSLFGPWLSPNSAQWAQRDLRPIFPQMLICTLAAPMPMGWVHGSKGLLLCTDYIGVLGNMRTHVLSTEVHLHKPQK